ncbi:MAG: leucyl/phenylalanyl-tRNA--protein transferase [Saprospiraceae bacterium]|nr:leucyl/phenylalanyl-tRNA--protein transferase [Saprospiraceae bacterium]
MLFVEDDYIFPHPDCVNRYGILAVGGVLDKKSLFTAYLYGIFPWYNYEHEPIIWWNPVPRFVIFPENVKVAKSMKVYFNQNRFRVTFDQCFESVIRSCEMAPRKGQEGTWINEDIIYSYTELFYAGFASSVEVWDGDSLVGGLYGVKIGKIFFGESMFSLVPNASKFGFIKLASRLAEEGFFVIDCQQPNDYLKSLGGEFITGDLWKICCSGIENISFRTIFWLPQNR